MDLQQILTLFLNSNPKWRSKLEAMTGQPSEYSIKCVNNFLEELRRGPGLKKPADKLQEFNANYQLVMGLGGFQEYEAQRYKTQYASYLARLFDNTRERIHRNLSEDYQQSNVCYLKLCGKERLYPHKPDAQMWKYG